MIKFIPKNVSEPIVSFVGQINNSNVYSIKFDVTINEVENAPSKYREEIGSDTIDVDLYAYLNDTTAFVCVDNATHSPIFNWNGDTPTGIFYFKDLYDFINGENSYIYQEYRIEKIEFIPNEQNSSRANLAYLTLSSVVNLNAGDTFMIESNEVIGTSDIHDVTLAGAYTLETEPCGNVLKIRFRQAIDLNPGMSRVKYMTMPNRLYKYALSYSRLGYDYSKVTSKIVWDHDASVNDEKVNDGDTVYPYTTRANKRLASFVSRICTALWKTLTIRTDTSMLNQRILLIFQRALKSRLVDTIISNIATTELNQRIGRKPLMMRSTIRWQVIPYLLGVRILGNWKETLS